MSLWMGPSSISSISSWLISLKCLVPGILCQRKTFYNQLGRWTCWQRWNRSTREWERLSLTALSWLLAGQRSGVQAVTGQRTRRGVNKKEQLQVKGLWMLKVMWPRVILQIRPTCIYTSHSIKTLFLTIGKIMVITYPSTSLNTD